MTEDRSPLLFDRLKVAIEDLRPAVVATVLTGSLSGAKLLLLFDPVNNPTVSETVGSLGDPVLDANVHGLAIAQLQDERSATVAVPNQEGASTDIFIESFAPPPLLVIFGAVHIAQALCQFAKHLGYYVIVSDARSALATDERFPEADRIIRAWPDDAFAEIRVSATAAIAILTHDPKFDEPAILSALQTPARYIGAVGSRKTNEDRRERLASAGATPDQIMRVRGPIGLNIGAESPDEMAIAIMAEIISVKYGRPGGSLATATGRIRGDAER